MRGRTHAARGESPRKHRAAAAVHPPAILGLLLFHRTLSCQLRVDHRRLCANSRGGRRTGTRDLHFFGTVLDDPAARRGICFGCQPLLEKFILACGLSGNQHRVHLFASRLRVGCLERRHAMKIVMTGSTGLVGRNFARAGVRDGYFQIISR